MVSELMLVAGLLGIKFDYALGEDGQSKLEVLVIALLLVACCEPAVDAHLGCVYGQ